MQIKRTDKTALTGQEILQYIQDYENNEVKRMDKLWAYYQGKNTNILNRKIYGDNETINRDNSFSSKLPGQANVGSSASKMAPDNLVPIPYGRKIITTYTGYAYRPKYITYKPIEIKEELQRSDEINGNLAKKIPIGSANDKIPVEMENVVPEVTNTVKEIQGKMAEDIKSFIMLMRNFRINNEHIRTSRAGRNTGIFGVSYELLFTDGILNAKTLSMEAEVRFLTVDPREMILFYDYGSDPKKILAIRYYRITDDRYSVEVYYPDRIEKWTRMRGSDQEWAIVKNGVSVPNFFGEIPVVAYYFGDEMLGLIEPIIPLIDCYDVLISDSMNEFDRFANAYLILKKLNLVDPLKKKEPGAFSKALANLKRFRIFEGLDKDADVKFLTKDIPHQYIQFMTNLIQKQIHTQSHVPDFAGEKFTGASGIAIQRLLFDFENVCSDAEADFDVALYERMRLIYVIYRKLNKANGDYSVVNISHKRNSPLNLKEFADTAVAMKAAGFSSYLVADIMPDDVVPDVEEELGRQKEEREDMMPDVSDFQNKNLIVNPMEEDEEKSEEDME